jgi:hypothetical protein
MRLVVVLTVFAVAILVLSGVFTAVETAADTIDIEAGRVFYATLESMSDTYHWAGLKIVHSGASLSESNLPFASLTLDAPIIAQVPFPGDNFKDELHYYAAMMPSQFDMNNIEVIDSSDLFANQLFPQSTFPTFYPDMDGRSDNPYETFCCDMADVTIGGENFTAFVAQIEQNINYYLLKYDDGGTPRPLFLVEIQDEICYNSTLCVSEFMLPVSSNPYNFFAISKLPAYTYRFFIDGTESDVFGQTGLPYNLTIEVRNLYSGNLADGVNVLVGERNGQNLFVPYRFTGYVSDFYSIGETNGVGRETFLVAPTDYAGVADYEIYVGVIQNGMITSPEPLSIGNTDSLIQLSKPLTPSALYDNAKATVNTLNSINSFLFIWSSQLLQAYRYTIQYEISSDTWTVTPAHTGGSTFEVKSGAPNVITLSVTNLGFPQNSYTVRMRETGGHLIMNPYTASSPLNAKTRVSNSQNLPIGTEFIITPTSVGAVSSTIELEVLNADGVVIATLPAVIDSDLNIGSAGVSYNNDLLKTITNTMNQIVSSLFFALNN